MISFREQIILIIYFLIFGMFLSAMFDILHYFLRKLKIKLIFSYVIELIFWVAMVIIACLYMLKISDGYLTIYTFGFFFLGVVIYAYLLRDNFKNNLDLFVVYVSKLFNKYKKPIIVVIYPKEVFTFITKAVKKTICLIIKAFKKIVKLFIKKEHVGEKDEEIKENDNFGGVSTINNSNEWL